MSYGDGKTAMFDHPVEGRYWIVDTHRWSLQGHNKGSGSEHLNSWNTHLRPFKLSVRPVVGSDHNMTRLEEHAIMFDCHACVMDRQDNIKVGIHCTWFRNSLEECMTNWYDYIKLIRTEIIQDIMKLD